jgi:hypothetical protein
MAEPLTEEEITIVIEVDRSESGQFRIDGISPGPDAIRISAKRVRHLEAAGLVRRRFVCGWRTHDFWCLTDAGHVRARALAEAR